LVKEAAELLSFAALHFKEQYARLQGMKKIFAITCKGEHP
jgi:hypothetical protein